MWCRGEGWARSLEVRLQGGRRLFVKLAQGSDSAMFEGEARGLQALAEGGALRVPQVLHWGLLPGLPGQAAASFIVMEHLELEGEGPGSAVHQEQLGRQLATMHMALPKDIEAAAGRFGFPVDNTIGGTAQHNAWTEDWVEFFREQRLAHMLRLLGDSRLSQLGQQLLPRLDHFFRDITVRPSVLHGDLWSGNIGRADGQPVVFDPATYYGHHEAEFGMSWCAGFTTAFWDAYWAVLPKQPGWEERHQLYTLYHILNHAVLFGGGYAAQAQALMHSLIAKLPA
ncbi:Fructosamine/Ketosamine-3-kinase [Haematococcus lacustris]